MAPNGSVDPSPIFETFGHGRHPRAETLIGLMPWIYRLIEREDHSWVCRFGLTDFDSHLKLDNALEHLRTLAAEVECDDIRIHRLDGSIDAIRVQG